MPNRPAPIAPLPPWLNPAPAPAAAAPAPQPRSIPAIPTPTPWLPAPKTRPARLPDPDRLDTMHPGSGAPVRELAAAHRHAAATAAAVEDHRPGGHAWARAAAADTAAARTGHTGPWQIADLIRTDPDRWAAAAAAAAAAATPATRLQQLRADTALHRAIETVLADTAARLAAAAADAYRHAATGTTADRATALMHLVDMRRLMADTAELRGLHAWATGHDHEYDPTGWGPEADPATKGHILAATDLLDPAGRRVDLPQDVEWPDGYDPLAMQVDPAEWNQFHRDGYISRGK